MSKYNITVQPTNSENIVKFVTNSFLTQSKSYEFNNIDDAKNSPLAQQLFHLPFVKTIYITQNFIAIDKYSFETTKVNWTDVQEDVASVISDYLNSGEAIIVETETVSEENSTKKVPITIYAESTPNPAAMKFVANKSLTSDTYEFKTQKDAIYAPLASELFNFPFVKEVFISANYISISKIDGVEWQEITNELREYIRSYIESGKNIFKDEIFQKEDHLTSENVNVKYSEIEKEIISILNEYVKPAVEGDGGNIAFHSYNSDTKNVKVILQGACSGCPSSTITLKQGIETMLRDMMRGKVETVDAING
ncbi:MAG: NifU family protein [Flavobacteriaceae bacterium]|nr:NifU family protein [Flavobacteriaceae bacterium]